MAVAVDHALMVLGWNELSDEDRPPERIWLIPRMLNEHFEQVRERYRAKAQGMEPIDANAPMLQNPATANIKL